MGKKCLKLKDLSDRLGKTKCAAVQRLTAGKDYLPAGASLADEGQPNYRKKMVLEFPP